MLKEPKRRILWITPDQAEALCQALPKHLEAMCRFSLATGKFRSTRCMDTCRSIEVWSGHWDSTQ
jgi:hypothetical protein